MGNIIFGEEGEAAAAFLMWGKRQQWVPTHLHSHDFSLTFLALSFLPLIYNSQDVNLDLA